MHHLPRQCSCKQINFVDRDYAKSQDNKIRLKNKASFLQAMRCNMCIIAASWSCIFNSRAIYVQCTYIHIRLVPE